MNTLKRKLTAILLTFAMLFSLMPALPQAAEAATVQGAGYVTLSYENNGAINDKTITVHVMLNDTEVDSFSISDAKTADNHVSITVNDTSKYVIGMIVMNRDFASTMEDTLQSWSCLADGNSEINVYLVDKEDPVAPNGVRTGSHQYRLDDAQIDKLLYLQTGEQLDDINVTGIDVNFKEKHGALSEQIMNHDLADGSWYIDLLYSPDLSHTGTGSPYNIESITIEYNEKETTIPAEGLRFVLQDNGNYTIESSNDNVHVLYFYNQEDGYTHYSLYAKRYVNDGDMLGELDMPKEPIYGNGNAYEFVNWTIEGTETAFYSNTRVYSDMNLYAKKVSSAEAGGIYIHVMNETDDLLNRIVEVYNAEHGTAITVDDIQKDSMRMKANDSDGKTSTNPDYIGNGWKEDNTYFLINNHSVSGAVGDTQNDHVGYNTIESVTVYFFVENDSEKTLTIPVGQNAGELSKVMIDGQSVLELSVIDPPTPPTFDQLEGEDGILGTNAVTVHCTTNTSEHQDITTGLLADSYSVSEKATWQKINGEAAYYVDVTVADDEYVKTYNEKNGAHTLDGEGTQTIILKWDTNANAWTSVTTLPVIFEVTCENEEPTKPEKPDEGTVEGLLKNAVKVVCNNGEATHENKDGKTYDLIKDGYKLAENVTGDADDGYTYTVTIQPDAYVLQYSTDTEVDHDLAPADQENKTITLEWNGTEWQVAEDSIPVTITVHCDSEEPTPTTPEKPDADDLNDLLDVELDCGSNVGHQDKVYENLLSESYILDDEVTTNTDGTYTIGVTVNSTAYIADYDGQELDPAGKHEIKKGEESSKTVTLMYNEDEKAWTVDNADKLITFLIVCSGTGDYDINGIAKDLVAGETDKNTATANGVKDFNGLTIPEENETVIIPAGGSVTLLYSITVEGKAHVEFDVTDDNTTLVPSHAAVTRNEDGTYSGTIPDSGSVTFYVSKTFTGADLENGKLVNRASVDGAKNETEVDPDPDVDEEVDAVEAFGITPADITIYEGGNGYGGVLDAEDNIIDDTISSGLPEPGYFITLPADVQKWLQEQSSEIGAEDLSHFMTFTYEGTDGAGDTTRRTWNLEYHGVYETDENGAPLRYVYGLTPAEVDGKEIPVRLNYFDDKNSNGKADAGEIITSDEITMAEDLASDTFKMTINPGELDQSQIQATFKVGEETKEYPITIGTGTLTVKSVVDEEAATNAIATDETGVDRNTLTAVAGAGVEYFVNDSEVKIEDATRVELLVDEVSNSYEFNAEMGQDAIETVEGNASTHSYKLAYMDLVDVDNGHAEVTLGEGDSLTIYWPMPEDADEKGEFQVVHYTDMDREETVDDLTAVETEKPTVIKKTIDGQVYLTFTTTGFSPFALVYEKANGGQNPGDNDPWYPWHPGGSGDGPSGLNTEDHFSYVVGYEDGMVKPQRSITRAEVATIFYRLLEDDIRDDYDTTRNNFSDVTSDSWYNQTVSTLASMGILKGYEDGTFRPNASITRAEFAAIATRFFEETGATYEPGTFTDVTGDEWFAGAIMDAVNLGLIGGYEDGTVRPNNNITRAEACAIVNRTLGRVPDADHLLPADEMTTWPDNPSSAWFYADMQEATNGHEYEWITEDGNKIEEWTDILDKDWNDR